MGITTCGQIDGLNSSFEALGFTFWSGPVFTMHQLIKTSSAREFLSDLAPFTNPKPDCACVMCQTWLTMGVTRLGVRGYVHRYFKEQVPRKACPSGLIHTKSEVMAARNPSLLWGLIYNWTAHHLAKKKKNKIKFHRLSLMLIDSSRFSSFSYLCVCVTGHLLLLRNVDELAVQFANKLRTKSQGIPRIWESDNFFL